jgi:hypothetical protein
MSASGAYLPTNLPAPGVLGHEQRRRARAAFANTLRVDRAAWGTLAHRRHVDDLLSTIHTQGAVKAIAASLQVAAETAGRLGTRQALADLIPRTGAEYVRDLLPPVRASDLAGASLRAALTEAGVAAAASGNVKAYAGFRQLAQPSSEQIREMLAAMPSPAELEETRALLHALPQTKPVPAVLPASPVEPPRPRSRRPAATQHRAYVLGGELALGRRGEVEDFLGEAGLSLALDELAAIEERLEVNAAIPRKDAAGSTRRLLVAVADHVYRPRPILVVDRTGETHRVGGKDVVNRLGAYIDDSRILSDVEQEVIGKQIHLLWRSVSEGIHRLADWRDAKHDYAQLLDILAVVARCAG